MSANHCVGDDSKASWLSLLIWTTLSTLVLKLFRVILQRCNKAKRPGLKLCSPPSHTPTPTENGSPSTPPHHTCTDPGPSMAKIEGGTKGLCPCQGTHLASPRGTPLGKQHYTHPSAEPSVFFVLQAGHTPRMRSPQHKPLGFLHHVVRTARHAP